MNKTVRVNFMVTKEEKAVLDEIAKELNVSKSELFSQYIHVLSKAMHKELRDPEKDILELLMKR